MASYIDLSTLHTPTPRAKPPASWAAQIRENFEWFQQNRRVICTSSTRPTGFEGLEIYETDTDLVYIHNGATFVEVTRLGAPRTYTPVVAQSGAVNKTVDIANYWKVGRLRYVDLFLTMTGSGGGSTTITVTTPDTMVYSGSPTQVLGQGSVVDQSGGPVFYTGAVLAVTTTTVCIQVHNSLAALGAAPAFTLVSTDTISMSFRYYSTT